MFHSSSVLTLFLSIVCVLDVRLFCCACFFDFVTFKLLNAACCCDTLVSVFLDFSLGVLGCFLYTLCKNGIVVLCLQLVHYIVIVFTICCTLFSILH